MSLSCIIESLHKITREDGFNLVVLGQNVHVKVWIHYFIDDNEGNNKWLGQYSGNHEGIQWPYRDCKCTFDNSNKTNPICVYPTLEDIKETKRRKRNNNDGGVQYFKLVLMYDIKNAFFERFIPLSNNVHGPFRMMPPELLHTSGSGLIMYMFESLRYHLRRGIDHDYIDQEHAVVNNMIKRQSKRDFPCGLMRNSLIDGTKCQLSERKGNLFQLLCIAHWTKARLVLKTALGLSDIQWRKFIHFWKVILLWKNGLMTATTKMKLIVQEGKYPKFLLHYKHSSPGCSTLTATDFPKCMEWLKCSPI